jgi:predicted phosphate transport protein (TIGR00153 family)
MARFGLIPREERFFELFAKNADNALAAARALNELFDDYTDVERKVRRLKDIEHTADEVTHEIFHALDRSFVAPFDREDIARLAGALDDVIDWIEEAGKRLHVYRIAEPTELARRFGRVLLEQGECIARAVPLIAQSKKSPELREQVVELHRLENEADDFMVEALKTLYDGVTEVPALVMAVKWGDIYTVLEEATDKCEHVGVAIESILVKLS